MLRTKVTGTERQYLTLKVYCDGKEAGNYATIREQSIPDKGYTQCKGLLKMQKTGGFKGQVEVSMLGA